MGVITNNIWLIMGTITLVSALVMNYNIWKDEWNEND